MKLKTWLADEGALDYLAHATPSAPKPRSRPKAPARPMPWRRIGKLAALAHGSFVVAALAIELGPAARSVVLAGSVFVATAVSGAAAAVTVAVAPVFATLVFALVVFSVRRR